MLQKFISKNLRSLIKFRSINLTLFLEPDGCLLLRKTPRMRETLHNFNTNFYREIIQHPKRFNISQRLF